MPYQNDMSTLAQIVGPAYAAQQAGIANENENQLENAKAQVAQGTIQPDIQKAGLQNLFTQAQTGNVNAETQSRQLANQFTQATQPAAIGANIAGSQAKMTADQSQKIGSLGQLAGQLAGYMDNVPPPARQAEMARILQQNNVDPSQLGQLASGDPDALRQFSQKAIQASAGFQQEIFKQGAETERATQVAGITSSGRQQAAEIAADARRAVADTQASVRKATAGLGALQQQLYAKVANGTATPAERQALDSMNQVQQLTRGGQPFTASITGTQVNPNVPGVPNTTPGGAPQGPGVTQQGATVSDGTYEYMTTPDGRTLRRPVQSK